MDSLKETIEKLKTEGYSLNKKDHGNNPKYSLVSMNGVFYGNADTVKSYMNLVDTSSLCDVRFTIEATCDHGLHLQKEIDGMLG